MLLFAFPIGGNFNPFIDAVLDLYVLIHGKESTTAAQIDDFIPELIARLERMLPESD